MEVGPDNWELIVETYREETNRPGYPPFGCFQGYSVCPVGIITPLSLELWQIFRACSGYSRVSTPAEFYALPAIYVEACQIIEAELARVDSGKS